jgi:hypothetical protein
MLHTVCRIGKVPPDAASPMQPSRKPSPRDVSSAGRQRVLALTLGACATAGLLATAGTAAAAPAYQVRTLVTGLENPRGLAIAPNGKLFISEAGTGRPTDRPTDGGCMLAGSGYGLCYGETGAVGIFNPSNNIYSRALSGLPSLARPSNQQEGSGIQDLFFDGAGQLYGVFGFGGDPTQIPDPLIKSEAYKFFGKTVFLGTEEKASSPQILADIAGFEVAQNPDKGGLNSNPFALVMHGGNTYVTDAGGNSLLKADSAQQVSLENVFEDKLVSTTHLPFPFPFKEIPAQAVPTGMAIGPDGALYIGQLSGFPFAPGSADVYRHDVLDPLKPMTRFAGGFSNLIDIAAGPDDSLYLLQYSDDFFDPDAPGSILKLSLLDGSLERVFDDLVQPTGLAVGADGTIYVANQGDGVNGQLLALTPVPAPAPLPLLGVGIAFAQSRRLRRRCGALSRPRSAMARPSAPPAAASGFDRASPER